MVPYHCRTWQAVLMVLCMVQVGSGRSASVRRVSQECHDSLRKYTLCHTLSDLYTLCSTSYLFESTYVQEMLDCTNTSPNVCQQKCKKMAGQLVNDTLDSPCAPDYQAMHGFSAPLNLFTVGNVDTVTNVSQSFVIPMPNLKGLGGPSAISYGNPGKCAQISSGQYCVLSGVLKLARTPTVFSLGNCLPKACSENELSATIADVQGNLSETLALRVQCNLVRPLGEPTASSKTTEDLLGWGGIPVEYPNTIEVSTGFWRMAALLFFLVVLVVAGTSLDWRRESKQRMLDALRDGDHLSLTSPGMEAAVPFAREAQELPPRSKLEAFFNHWSLLRNGRSLLRSRPESQSTFACLDAIRTISMGQVILGHMYVFALPSAGLANLEQFNPPHGLLGQLGFQVIPGCFYGVDSFFVMSGFLCAYQLQQKVFSQPANRAPMKFGGMYLKFILLRYLRLTPLLMFCIALVMTILPMLGSGILWNLERPGSGYCFEAAGSAGCSEYWWTNLLYLQDLDRYAAKCFAHGWYLANDFQLYLTAPFFAWAYSFNKKLGWALLVACLLTGVSIPMVMTAQEHWVPELIAGATHGFNSKFYFKPWCRCPAFLVGIATAWLWSEYFESFKGRHTTIPARMRSYFFSFLGLSLCLAATFGRAAFFQCELPDCFEPDASPVPIFLQYMWAGFGILTWCVGLSIIMILCFQNRFLPLLQGFLCSPVFQPIAKLSYAAYLIHPSILILNYCQRDSPVEYNFSAFAYNFVAFVTFSALAAFGLYVLVEKPLANLQMKLLGGGGGD